MSSEEQRLESKILYFEDMMFRCKEYENGSLTAALSFCGHSTEVVFTIVYF